MSKYAKYYKCALQVNPFSYSEYRGKEKHNEQMYNEEILTKCKENNIDIVGLANHGDVDSSESLRSYLVEHGIVVFPGFEITTAEKIHIVCLFPENKSLSELNKYIGALGLSNAKDGTATSTQTCEQIAKNIDESGGFWYAAHATGDGGILKLGKLNHIWKSDSLVAVQIPDSKENIDPNYKKIIDNKDPQYKRDKPVAFINASDVESPQDLEKPAATTLIKMSEPKFSHFITAFKDPESRVRLNSELEENYQSSIDQIRVFGGYLDGFNVNFSTHLDTLIGGRGTGKSTVINLIRYAAGLEPDAKINNERRKEFDDMIEHNLGSNSRVELSVTSYKQHGKHFKIIRRYKNVPVIEDMDGNVLPLSVMDLLPKLEVYGQNEIVDAVSNSTFIYSILKRLFTADESLKTAISTAYDKLHGNTEQIIKLLDECDNDDDVIADLPALKEQYKYYKDSGIEKKLPALKKIAAEEAAYEKFNKDIKTFVSPSWQTIEVPIESDEIDLSELKKIAETYNKKIERVQKDYDSSVEWLSSEYSKAKSKWMKDKEKSEADIHKSLKEIDGVQDKSGTEIANEFAELVKEIKLAEPIQRRQSSRRTELEGLVKKRKTLIEGCRKARDSYSTEIGKQIKNLNKKKFDYTIRVSVKFNQDKGTLIEELKKIPGIGDKGLMGIVEYKDFDILQFAEDIRSGEAKLESTYALTSGIAKKIYEHYDDKALYRLEELQLGDIYELELLVNNQYKKLDRLSKGQQCTAVLNVLLIDNKDPLIIDQPEDNLDNAFIADSLISTIRENKIKRQYIFATHNANIPVFGDAELIITMKEDDGHGYSPQELVGSIDSPNVKESVINVLEGGKDAFLMREKKYGL